MCKQTVDSKQQTGEKKKHWTEDHHRGWRTISGREIYFPNRMEANYYRYLCFLLAQGAITNFLYQPVELDFRKFGVTRGIVTYKPDFLVNEIRPWTCKHGFYLVEVKGWFGLDHKTKMNRMRKFYPDIKIKVVSYRDYWEIAKKVSKIIPNWEE